MSNAWAAAIHLLEDDQPVGPPAEPTPEEIDRIDDPVAYIQKRFEDYYFQYQYRLGGKKKKKLDRNTYLLQHPNGVITVRYHNTDIVTIYPDNAVRISTRGKGADKYYGATVNRFGMAVSHPWAHYGEERTWQTRSTMDRLNRFMPGHWRLYQRKGDWYWHDREHPEVAIPFTEGDRILGTGELEAQAAHERPATHP